jgi:hypothetical protein
MKIHLFEIELSPVPSWCSTLVGPWRHDYNRILSYLQRKRIGYPQCQSLSHFLFQMKMLS